MPCPALFSSIFLFSLFFRTPSFILFILRAKNKKAFSTRLKRSKRRYVKKCFSLPRCTYDLYAFLCALLRTVLIYSSQLYSVSCVLPSVLYFSREFFSSCVLFLVLPHSALLQTFFDLAKLFPLLPVFYSSLLYYYYSLLFLPRCNACFS